MLANKERTPDIVSRYTSAEINHQPALWSKIWLKIQEEELELKTFLSNITSDFSIVLTGAGTSAYIGLTVQSVFRKKFNLIAEPISTTHIVSHPQDHLLPDSKVLMVSFARSGNSPESCAAVDI